MRRSWPHRGLAPTRGAALAIARVDTGASLVRFVGIGNITGTLVSDGDARRMASHNGTAGHVAPRIREFTYPFTGKPLVILHSDGLSTRWGLADYPGLAVSHPSLIAGILILAVPGLLNYIVAIYLVVIRLLGLFGSHFH